MIEKTMRMNYLFDFYSSLLTEKQQIYLSLYYFEDYSLGEIAQEYDVSRQAVYDNIKRTEIMLEEYEEKLLLFQKFQERKSTIEQLRSLNESGDLSKNQIEEYLHALEKLD